MEDAFFIPVVIEEQMAAEFFKIIYIKYLIKKT